MLYFNTTGQVYDEEKIEVISKILDTKFTFDSDMFLLDYWSEEQALMYLAGISEIVIDESDSVYYLMLDGSYFIGDRIIELPYEKELERLKRLWRSGVHKERNPPEYYIDWALSKKHKIRWLDYAIKQGFYKNTQIQVNETSAASNFDWPIFARQIGIDIYEKKPKLSISQISLLVHNEMIALSKSGKDGMTGRGGKIPSADSIKRHALGGIKTQGIGALPKRPTCTPR